MDGRQIVAGGFFFSEKIRLHSPSSPARLCGKLRQEESLRGSVGEGDFVIDGIRTYGSYFSLRLVGSVVPVPAGSEIDVTARPNREVVFFLSVWLVFLLVLSAVMIISFRGGNPLRYLFLLVPAALAALSWFLTTAVLRGDSRWARRILEETLLGSSAGEMPPRAGKEAP